MVPDTGKVPPPRKGCRPDKKSELFMAQLTEAKITKEEGLVSHASPKKGGTPMKSEKTSNPREPLIPRDPNRRLSIVAGIHSKQLSVCRTCQTEHFKCHMFCLCPCVYNSAHPVDEQRIYAGYSDSATSSSLMILLAPFMVKRLM